MSSFERCVILVVDDEPGVLGLTATVLSRHGYDVIRASDGLSALRACEECQKAIHLALLDIVMPGMTGPELLVELQSLHPKIEVLFMSGYQPGNITLPALGPCRFIAKPFLPRALLQRVNEILGNEDVCVLLDDEAETATA